MTQNLVSLNLPAADLADIDAALATLETKLAGLIALSVDERRTLAKMGPKSEAFCRQTLVVLAQNTQMLPAGFDLAEAQNDLANLDTLRSRTARLSQLLGKAEDTEMALGSDVMNAALEGYALLKVVGKGAGLEALRQSMSARYTRSASKPEKVAGNAPSVAA
jgi:hypothetical protein